MAWGFQMVGSRNEILIGLALVTSSNAVEQDQIDSVTDYVGTQIQPHATPTGRSVGELYYEGPLEVKISGSWTQTSSVVRVEINVVRKTTFGEIQTGSPNPINSGTQPGSA